MKSALLVIDVQQSFTRRPYWSEAERYRATDTIVKLSELLDVHS